MVTAGQMWLMVGVVLYFSRGFFGMFLPNPEKGQNMQVANALGLSQSVSATSTPTAYQNYAINYGTQTPYPTYTPQATFTPSVGWLRGSPTVTQVSFLPNQVNWVFSYYYPDLVGEDEEKYASNCHSDNIERNPQGKAIGCKNTSASGLGWRDWIFDEAIDNDYRGGLAVPYYPDTLVPLYPFGTIVHVVEPSVIAGNWLVMDLCPACDDYIRSHDVLFLDFIMRGLPNNVTFWDKVVIDLVTYP